MALHAVVYKNSGTLPPQLRKLVRLVDPMTGELEFVTFERSDQLTEDRLVATSISLGNVSMVAWLTKEIAARWGNKCEILSRTFLYSGSHSGDVVGCDQVGQISQELDKIDLAEIGLPKDLAEFISSVRQLVTAAEAEKNPIVFV